MNKKRKELVLLGVILLLLLGGAFIGFTQYYNQEKIKQVFLDSLKSTFPASNIDLGELKVNYGTSIKVSGKSFSTENFKVEEFQAKASLLSFITGAGYVEVLLKDSTFDLTQGKDPKMANEIQVPAFVVNSSGSVRFEGLEVIHHKEKAPIKIERLILKNLGLRSVAAFEVKSNSSYIEGLQSENYVFGSLDLKQYLEKKVLPINAELKINNPVWKGQKGLLPTVNGNLDIEVTESGDVKGKVKLKQQSSNVELSGTLSNGELKVESFKATLQGEDFNPLFISKSLPRQVKSSLIEASGSLLWNDKSFQPKLKLSLSQWNTRLGRFEGSVNGDVSYEDKKLAFDTFLNEANQVRALSCKTDLNLEKKEFQKAFSNYDCLLNLEKGEIQKIDFKEMMHALKNKKGELIRLPSGRLKIKALETIFRNHSLEGEVNVKTSEAKIELKGQIKSENNLKISLDEEISVFEDELRRKGKLVVNGSDISEVAKFLKINNPLVKSSESFQTDLEYEETVLADGGAGQNKKVYLKHHGKGLGLNGNFLVKKMDSVKEELEKWDLWNSVKDDIDQKSFFNSFTLEARRTEDVYLVSKLELTRGKKRISGKGIFKRVDGTYLGNLDLKIKKGKRKPMSIFLIKDLKGFRLDRNKILKQF